MSETLTIDMEAEADLNAVANGDFNELSLPILVAAATLEQFEEFVFSNGLTFAECRRFRTYGRHDDSPDSKILLLLPYYHEDPTTDEAVEQWVVADRYTVALDEPRPLVRPAVFWCFCASVITVTLLAAIIWKSL